MRLLNTEITSSESVIDLAKRIMADRTRFERLQIIGDLKNEYYKRNIKLSSMLEQYKLTPTKELFNKHTVKAFEAQCVRELYEILEQGETK